MDTKNVTRVEIINYADSKGRVYSFGPRPGVKVELSVQDGGQTLKVFIEAQKDGKLPPGTPAWLNRVK